MAAPSLQRQCVAGRARVAETQGPSLLPERGPAYLAGRECRQRPTSTLLHFVPLLPRVLDAHSDLAISIGYAVIDIERNGLASSRSRSR